MNDAKLRQKIERFADAFEATDFIVTRRLEVDVNGAAQFLNASARTLRNWRSYGVGPAWRIRAGRAWYLIADLLAWRDGKRSRDACVLDNPRLQGAKSVTLDSSDSKSPVHDGCRRQ